jgi:hypothetical protein
VLLNCVLWARDDTGRWCKGSGRFVAILGWMGGTGAESELGEEGHTAAPVSFSLTTFARARASTPVPPNHIIPVRRSPTATFLAQYSPQKVTSSTQTLATRRVRLCAGVVQL